VEKRYMPTRRSQLRRVQKKRAKTLNLPANPKTIEFEVPDQLKRFSDDTQFLLYDSGTSDPKVGLIQAIFASSDQRTVFSGCSY
jgi:hypothetical protein